METFGTGTSSSTLTGAIFVGVGQGTSGTGTLTADADTSFSAGGLLGQLRFYLPSEASNLITAGALLNGTSADPPGPVFPNFQGAFAFGTGPYVPAAGNFAFYVTDPSRVVLGGGGDSVNFLPGSGGGASSASASSFTSSTNSFLDPFLFFLLKFEMPDDRRFPLGWYQGPIWPNTGTLQYEHFHSKHKPGTLLQGTSADLFGNGTNGGTP